MADEIKPPTDAEIQRVLDEERGTLFNWLEFPSFLELEKGRVTEYPDRAWVNDITEMLKTDGQAAGVETALTMALRQANYTLEMPKGPNAKAITEEVEDVLFRPATEGGMTTPFDLVFGQMTSAAAYARTYHELVWTRRPNGKLGYSKIAWRPPASCELLRRRDNGELDGFKQFLEWDVARRTNGVDWMGFVEIPSNRSVIHINNQHRDPVFGWSDLSVTNWAFQLKRRVVALWVTLLGRAAEPWVLAYGKTAPEAKNNAKQIAGLKSGGVAAVTRPVVDGDQAKMFDVLETNATGAAALYRDCLAYLDGMMTQSVMAGWMDLTGAASQSGAGSYALSADQSGLFLASRHGAARELSATINYQIIRPLVRVNWGPRAPVPLLKVEKIGQDQVAKAMELLATLGGSQALNVPAEFIGLLIERVAAYLDLPDARVREIIDEHAKRTRQEAAAQGQPQAPAGTPEGSLQDAVNGAVGAVTQATGAPLGVSPATSPEPT